MVVSIVRFEQNDKQTLGKGFVYTDSYDRVFKFFTLELPWRDNQNNISCIPDGVYELRKRYSKKYGHHFQVMDVVGRSYILIHHGNYYTQTEGCLLAGDSHTDINNDGLKDVTNSVNTMERLNYFLPDVSSLVIETNLLAI